MFIITLYDWLLQYLYLFIHKADQIGHRYTKMKSTELQYIEKNDRPITVEGKQGMCWEFWQGKKRNPLADPAQA
jgi:hypothetical protein